MRLTSLTALPGLALAASGVAGVLIPGKVADALELPATTGRGRAEARAGLGGTYAGLGMWALVTDSAASRAAVGATWLGAAAARLYSLSVDPPETDWTFWAYLAGELGLGSLALATAAAARLAARRAAPE